MIYVLSESGKPLMPTERNGRVRRMLRDGLAVVVRREPFTIQLTYDSKQFTQPVVLGVDAGSEHVGMSASTESRELYSSETQLRTDIQKLIKTRQEARRTRRSRKTRYRQARFDNRRRKDGWLAPSVEQKVQSHIRLIEKVCSILPVSRIVIEVAQFDTQLLKNPEIQGVEYQQGPQLGFWNTREYVLFRDNHTCRNCKGRSGDKVLNVHHLIPRIQGGPDSPDNLITLCETCHNRHHREGLKLKIKPSSKSLRDAAIMSMMRWAIYNRAKALWNNVHLTYGYITKHVRIENELEKSHHVDALCIAGHPKAQPCENWFMMRQIARHTRSLHVFTPAKGGTRRSTIASHFIGKTRLQRFDKVLWNGLTAFIFGSTNGRPVLRNIEGKLVTDKPSVNAKTVKFLYRKHGNYIIQTI